MSCNNFLVSFRCCFIYASHTWIRLIVTLRLNHARLLRLFHISGFIPRTQKMLLAKHSLMRFGVRERQEYFKTKIDKLNSISFRVSKKRNALPWDQYTTMSQIVRVIIAITSWIQRPFLRSLQWRTTCCMPRKHTKKKTQAQIQKHWAYT